MRSRDVSWEIWRHKKCCCILIKVLNYALGRHAICLHLLIRSILLYLNRSDVFFHILIVTIVPSWVSLRCCYCCCSLHAPFLLQSLNSSDLIFRPGNCICSYTLAYAKHYNSETYIELIDDRNANIMEKWFYTFVNIEACALAQCPPFVPINLFFCERFDAIFFPEVKSDNMLLLNKSG